MKEETYEIGVIRVITSSDPEFIGCHGALIERNFPQLRVVSRCIEEQPQGVYNEETMALAEPKVLQVATAMAAEGAGAVIVSCMADPGVELAQQHLPIPVIGAGRAASALALAYSGSVGVLGITEDILDPIRRQLGPALKAYSRPKGVQTSLDLMTPEGMNNTVESAWKLKSNGAQVILLSCTGMSTIGAAGIIRENVRIPVIDPVLASGLVAYFGVKNCTYVEGVKGGIKTGT